MQTFQSNNEGLHILNEQEFPVLPPRRNLITWWMHLVMIGLLIVALVALGIAGHLTVLTWVSSYSQGVSMPVVGYLILLFVAAVTTSYFLVWAGWKHAVTFFLIPAAIVVFIQFLIVLGTCGAGNWQGLFLVPYMAAHGSLALKLYTIQDQWLKRPRKNALL